jgi:hypothetical protein
VSVTFSHLQQRILEDGNSGIGRQPFGFFGLPQISSRFLMLASVHGARRAAMTFKGFPK